MADLIDRQAAINAICRDWCNRDYCGDCYFYGARQAIDALKALPSAQPEVIPINYYDCSNAMLMMWMDNVVTDGEYNRIMDKLNAHWGKKDV